MVPFLSSASPQNMLFCLLDLHRTLSYVMELTFKLCATHCSCLNADIQKCFTFFPIPFALQLLLFIYYQLFETVNYIILTTGNFNFSWEHYIVPSTYYFILIADLLVVLLFLFLKRKISKCKTFKFLSPRCSIIQWHSNNPEHSL